MITPNIENTSTSSPSEPVNPNTTAKKHCMQKSIVSHILGNLIDFKATNITDYKIDILKEDEPQVFSKMKNSIPSTKDFLTLCIAKNQKLAADKLDIMLTNISKSKAFNWQLNHVNEDGFSFVGKDEFDNLGRPLVIAAKYGNTPVCKVIIKHTERETSSLGFSIMSVLAFSSVAKTYYYEIRCDEVEICLKSISKALKYNNIETAEYIYDVVCECIKKTYDHNLTHNIIEYELLKLIEKASTKLGLQFLLQKIADLISKDGKSNYNGIATKLVYSLVSWAENKNWDLVRYAMANYIDIFKKGSETSQGRFIYKALQNKQLDIAKDFIKNISVDIFNKRLGFLEIYFFGNPIFLDALKRDLDSETFNWLLANIKSNCINS